MIEVCGQQIPSGIEMLRTGGTYVIGGLVNPNAMLKIDGNSIQENVDHKGYT